MGAKSGLNNLKELSVDQADLLAWYLANKRELPWRKHKNNYKDPYKIWISEVMLQQTTVAAVIPYYEKFIARFPTVSALASAKEDEVLERWAGLGYYSRARNLHRSAQHLAESGFYKTAAKLLELPGFGPYTSRAVASLAFDEPVGVLDGNVIRVLSRRYGLKLNWWNGKEKKILQDLADALANTKSNSNINQGLMELGATVCTPKKPLCLLCPWKKRCVALKTDQITTLPTPRPRAAIEIWHWVLRPQFKKDQIHLTPLLKSPFLKNLHFPDSSLSKLSKKPKAFHLKHSVTKYALYISIEPPKQPPPKTLQHGKWVNLKDVKKINPTSLLTKILKFSEKNGKIKL